MTIPDEPNGILVLIGSRLPAILGWRAISTTIVNPATQARVQQAEKRADETLERSKFEWDLARITLRSYFDKNLRQSVGDFLVERGCDVNPVLGSSSGASRSDNRVDQCDISRSLLPHAK